MRFQRPIAASIFDMGKRARMVAQLAVAVVAAVLTILSTAQAQLFSALHTFHGPDGAVPYAGVTMDIAGSLYGTTYYGGAHSSGLVYKLTHRGSGWLLSPLYSFQGPRSQDGNSPIGGITIGRDGNLYGTTSGGGAHFSGTVYKLSPPPTFCRTAICPWIETHLYEFTGGADGGSPQGDVIFDNAGNLYGTTYSGGTTGNGVVFKLTPSASGWTETVLHTFTDSPDGAGPFSGLTFDTIGNLYGTTGGGGNGHGAVFRLKPSGSGWTEQIIYAFHGGLDGAVPYAGVLLDAEGNVYGSTPYGGSGEGGTIFELTPSNDDWTFSVLYSPNLGNPTGGPIGTLVRSAAGNLYGTIFSGGDFQGCSGYGCGNVFELSPSNGGWVYTSLYEFTDGNDGGNPYAGVILDSTGNLYGTTSGLLGGDGGVFEIIP